MLVRWVEDDTRAPLLVRLGLLCQSEGVEATSHQEDPVTKTCRTCKRSGEIGVLFYVSTTTDCKSCTNARIHAHVKSVNEASKLKADNHGQPWSEAEVETLLAAVGEGMHVNDIAELLGRTYLATHTKLNSVRKLLRGHQPISYVIRTESVTTVTRQPQPVCDHCFVPKPCFCD